jgi:ethanolamine utilization protein EutN
MMTAKVISKVISTCKNENLDSKSLLVVEPVDPYGKVCGKEIVAIDNIGADIGEMVLVVREGSSAADLFGHAVPIQAVIVGIVDKITLEGE